MKTGSALIVPLYEAECYPHRIHSTFVYSVVYVHIQEAGDPTYMFIFDTYLFFRHLPKSSTLRDVGTV